MSSCFRKGRPRRRIVTLITACVAAFALSGMPVFAGDANAPGVNGVRLGTDSDSGVSLVSIKPNRDDDVEVAYSVKLPDVVNTEQFRIRHEMQVSRCNDGDFAAGKDCNGTSQYNYDPTINYKVIYADTSTSTSGVTIANWDSLTCTQGKHHCPVTLRDLTFSPNVDASAKRVNVLVSASAGNAGAGDKVVLEDGPHGDLTVFRLGANRKGSLSQPNDPANVVDDSTNVDQIPISVDRGGIVDRIVYSKQLNLLSAGEFIDARATVHVKNGPGYTYDPLVGVYILLSKTQGGKDPDGANGEPIVTAKNGQNCTDHTNDGCTFRKAGGVEVPANANSTMYLNVVAYSQRDSAPDTDNTHVITINDGELSRVRYTPAP